MFITYDASLETERLTLQPPRREDFEESAMMLSDPTVTQYTSGSPLDRPEAWARFLRDVGHWAVEGFGLLTVRERTTGIYVGKVGYAYFEQDLGSKAATSIEMSWTLTTFFQGRGLAQEAAKAAQHWFRQENPQKTACRISTENKSSLRLAAKLGYREVDQLTIAGGTQIILVDSLND